MLLWSFLIFLRFGWLQYHILFFGPPAVAGRVLWNTVCPSFRPSVCPGIFLELYHYFFSKFWHGTRNPFEVVCDKDGFSWKIFFAPKIRQVDQKWAKTLGFGNVLKHFVINFFWICFVMKIYIICCVQNFCSWDMGQNILSQSDCRIF